jgi:ADP-ribose pyrophosphatase
MKVIHQNEKGNRKFYYEEDKNYCIYDIPNIVSVLAVLPDGKLVLVEQYRVPANERTIELVCGGVEKGEDIEVAAIREVEEEIGYKVNTLQKIGTYMSCPGYTTEKVNLFIAHLQGTPVMQKLEQHEKDNDLKKVIVTIEEAFELCKTRIVKPELELALLKFLNY